MQLCVASLKCLEVRLELRVAGLKRRDLEQEVGAGRLELKSRLDSRTDSLLVRVETPAVRGQRRLARSDIIRMSAERGRVSVQLLVVLADGGGVVGDRCADRVERGGALSLRRANVALQLRVASLKCLEVRLELRDLDEQEVGAGRLELKSRLDSRGLRLELKSRLDSRGLLLHQADDADERGRRHEQRRRGEADEELALLARPVLAFGEDGASLGSRVGEGRGTRPGIFGVIVIGAAGGRSRAA